MNGHILLLAILLGPNTKPALAQKQLRFFVGSLPHQVDI
jgi:hypothetical protein